MALISLSQLSFTYSGPEFLTDVTFHLEKGERVCIIGRNGSGKSTLLRLMSNELSPGGGSCETAKDLRVGSLPQVVPENISGAVFDVVALGMGSKGKIISELERLGQRQGQESILEQMEQLRKQLGEDTEWELVTRINRIIKNCRLKPEDRVEVMSAGMKRRVLFARALAADPQVLLLDEPTNHLDIKTIQWLEEYLLQSDITLVFVTHDRMLVEKLATRIVELDRGKIFNWACDYKTYIQRRDQMLNAQDKQKANLDRLLKNEEAWLRQGVRARRTRNEGRVKALKQLRADRKAWRELTGSVNLKIQEAEKSGKQVIQMKNVSFGYDESQVIKGFSTAIMRGDRVGIMGANGCGKSTLLRLMLKELEPNSGTVKHGTKLQIAYFDQLRDQLDPDATVIDSIAGGLREVNIGGKKRHVYSYMKDFLFDPAVAEAPVRTLSGGERNRLLLARLFTKRANLLVMDEPTNDLDSDTLELLEDHLMDYTGTVLVVSHDRTFLNNVVHATLVFEDEHHIQEYAGGYDDWLIQRKQPSEDPSAKNKKSQKKSDTSSNQAKGEKKTTGKQKLSYKLKRELEQLPGEIEALEKEQNNLFEEMSGADFYLRAPDEIKTCEKRLKELETDLDARIERWAELDELAGDSSSSEC